jgi:hypothetical protein
MRHLAVFAVLAGGVCSCSSEVPIGPDPAPSLRAQAVPGGPGNGPAASRVNTPSNDPDQYVTFSVDIPQGAAPVALTPGPFMVTTLLGFYPPTIFTVQGTDCSSPDRIPLRTEYFCTNVRQCQIPIPTGQTLCTEYVATQYPPNLSFTASLVGYRPY